MWHLGAYMGYNLSLATDISAKGKASGKKKADKKGVNYYG